MATTPKYRIMAKRPGEELPRDHRWTGHYYELHWMADELQKKYPDDVIEIRQMFGFKDGDPIRWGLDKTGDLKPLTFYNETVSG